MVPDFVNGRYHINEEIDPNPEIGVTYRIEPGQLYWDGTKFQWYFNGVWEQPALLVYKSDGWYYVSNYTIRYMEMAPVYKGSLIQDNIVAAGGTYPNNGKHTDGYWHVKGEIANQNLTINVTIRSQNGTLQLEYNDEREVA